MRARHHDQLGMPRRGRRRRDLRPFVELACALGGEGFPAASAGNPWYWVAARHFNVLRIGAPRPELLLAGTRHRDAQLGVALLAGLFAVLPQP